MQSLLELDFSIDDEPREVSSVAGIRRAARCTSEAMQAAYYSTILEDTFAEIDVPE